MKSITVSILIALTIVVTVALFPASSWVFRNQVDLFSRLTSRSGSEGDGLADSLEPSWLSDPATYSGTDPAEQLTQALYTPHDQRNAALLRYANSHPNDPLGWAVLVRMTCMAGTHTPDELPTKDQSWRPKAEANLKMGLDACSKGEILEPNNAYFSLMRAEFEMELGHLAEMSEALNEAARKRAYDNHVRDEGAAMEKAQILEKGYRGEIVRMGSDAAIMLPDFAHIRAFGRYLNRKGTLGEKRNLIQTLDTISKGESTAIGFLVAYADIQLVIRPAMQISSSGNGGFSQAAVLAQAEGFDNELRAAGIAPPSPGTLTTYQTLKGLVEAVHQYIDNLPPQLEGDQSKLNVLFIRTVTPYSAIAGILLCVVLSAAAIGFARIQNDTFRRMLPHLLCLPVTVGTLMIVAPTCDYCGQLPLPGLLIGVGQLSIAFLQLNKRPASIMTAMTGAYLLLAIGFSSLILNAFALGTAGFCALIAAIPWLLDNEKRTRAGVWIGFVLVLFSFAAGDISAAMGGFAFAVSYGLLWKNRTGETPKFVSWATATVFLLMFAGAATVLVARLMSGISTTGLAAAILLGLVASALFTGKSLAVAQRTVSVSLVLFSTIYLVSVGWEVRANHPSEVGQSNFLNEGAKIRALAGVKSMRGS